jgi:hypothetical protein
MENPNFPERLKTTATPVNRNYLLLRLITLVLLGKAAVGNLLPWRLSCEEPVGDMKLYSC